MNANHNSLRPSTYLVEASKDRPGISKRIDAVIQQYQGNWPKWCFLPLNVCLFDEDSVERRDCDTILLILSAWKATQGVYRFDPDVIEELWNTSIKGDIPTDVLHYLPEWCVYIETGKRELVLNRTLHGFFVYLDHSLGEAADASDSVVLLLDIEVEDTARRMLMPYIFPTKIGAGVSPTIEEMISIYMDEKTSGFFPKDLTLWEDNPVKEMMQQELEDLLPRIFSLLLYLCSVNAEFRGTNDRNALPKHPLPIKTKNGARYFPPNQPMVWETAWRTGASIRAFRNRPVESDESGIGGRKRPHIRRSHWHTYWCGPRDGERNVRLIWLPPIPVNVDSDGDLIPVVRPVD